MANEHIVIKEKKEMFCSSCGKYNPDSKPVCSYCGGELVEIDDSVNQEALVKRDKTNFILGIVLGFLLNFIGVLFQYIWPKESIERADFFKGWVKGIIALVIAATVALEVIVWIIASTGSAVIITMFVVIVVACVLFDIFKK